MRPIEGDLCPVLNKECVRNKCHWFVQLMGKNPQTGLDMSEWGCAVAWIPILLIENAQRERQTGASIDSLRNEVIARVEAFPAALGRAMMGVAAIRRDGVKCLLP